MSQFPFTPPRSLTQFSDVVWKIKEIGRSSCSMKKNDKTKIYKKENVIEKVMTLELLCPLDFFLFYIFRIYEQV